jgi:hypothetical protein
VAADRRYLSEVSRPCLGVALIRPIGVTLIALGLRDSRAFNLVHVLAEAALAGATIEVTEVLYRH